MTISAPTALRGPVLGLFASVGILAPGGLRVPFGLAGGIALPCVAGTVWLVRRTRISRLFSAVLAMILLSVYWAVCGFVAAGLGVAWGTTTAVVVSVGANTILLGCLYRQEHPAGHWHQHRVRPLPSVFPYLDAAVRYALVADFDPTCPAPSRGEWEKGAGKLVQDRLAGVALRLIRERRLEAPPETILALREAEFAQSLVTGLVMMRAPDIIEGLTSAGVRAVVLKGPGLAAEERSLQERPFSDLDILVHPRDFRRSLALLRAAGLSEDRASLAPWDWCNRWCREAVNLKRQDGASVDLHHHVPPWLWTRRLTFDRVWQQSESLSVGAATLRVPSHPHRALLACLHVISDHGRPGETTRIWRDVMLTVNAVDELAFALEVEELRMTPWVRWLLGQLPTGVVSKSTLSNNLDAVAGGPGHSIRLRYVLKGAANRSSTLTHAARLPIPNSVLYGAAMTFPSREFLRWRPDGSRSRWHWFVGRRQRRSWAWANRPETAASAGGGHQ